MSEMKVTATRTRTKPKYDALAAELLARCRAFYEDPENERAYQEWKAGKDGQRDLVCAG